MPEWVYTDKLTPQTILAEQNAEVRRAMMEIYGIDRMVSMAKKKAVDDWGTLWEFPMKQRSGFPVTYLEVVNATPEPDGSFRHYFLRTRSSHKTPYDAWLASWRGPNGQLTHDELQKWELAQS